MPKPGAIAWYRAYAALLMVVHGVVFLMMVGMIFLQRWLPHSDVDLPAWIMIFYYAFLGMTALGMFGLYLASFFLERSPGAWTYHAIMICIGMTSPCFIPFGFPLLIFWIQDPVKNYFGKA